MKKLNNKDTSTLILVIKLLGWKQTSWHDCGGAPRLSSWKAYPEFGWHHSIKRGPGQDRKEKRSLASAVTLSASCQWMPCDQMRHTPATMTPL